MLTDEPVKTYLDTLHDDLKAYEQQAAIIEGLIAAGEDVEWNTGRLSGFRWNIQVTKNKIAREEANAQAVQP